MRVVRVVAISIAAIAIGAVFGAALASAQERALPLPALRSGITFAGSDVRAMQADDASNPGFLWVESGEKLWNAPAGTAGKSCASCHGDARSSMRGVAARHPRFDATAGTVQDLEARIGDCRVRRQQAAPLARESEERLSLTAYVALQSRGLQVEVTIDGSARAAFERGRAFYEARHGQMNIACAQCHEQNWGKRLLSETMSQGHGNAFPAYRLEWQSLGSLQRRLRACMTGIRAQPYDFGAPELVELELFLMSRAQGMPIEAPAVRP